MFFFVFKFQGISLYSDSKVNLGIQKGSIEAPLEVDNQGDAGERLIIAPKRYFADLTDEMMRPIIAKYAETHNVVVIVPNTTKQEAWAKFSSNIEGIQREFMVFLNRYDGVDLAGDSCRILVLDGKPSAYSACIQEIRAVCNWTPSYRKMISNVFTTGSILT